MDTFRLIAILGGSGSGKTALGLELASKLDCEIFSLDSLAIYRHFDIVSAKPNAQERSCIRHYGIDILDPHQPSNAMLFRALLLEAIQETQDRGKESMLLIGGSSFYLKSILEGLSPSPSLNPEQSLKIKEQINAIQDPYALLSQIDPLAPIHPNDSYRLHKALEIYFATGLAPSEYFASHPAQAFPYAIEKYAIALHRQELRDRIRRRTQAMLTKGLIEEIEGIYTHYDYSIQPSSAIGVRECLEYLRQEPLESLQGKPPRTRTIAKTPQELCELISTHTAQLAKRQETFNRRQFGRIYPSSKEPRTQAKEGIVWGNPKELAHTIPKA